MNCLDASPSVSELLRRAERAFAGDAALKRPYEVVCDYAGSLPARITKFALDLLERSAQNALLSLPLAIASCAALPPLQIQLLLGCVVAGAVVGCWLSRHRSSIAAFPLPSCATRFDFGCLLGIGSIAFGILRPWAGSLFASAIASYALDQLSQRWTKKPEQTSQMALHFDVNADDYVGVRLRPVA